MSSILSDAILHASKSIMNGIDLDVYLIGEVLGEAIC